MISEEQRDQFKKTHKIASRAEFELRIQFLLDLIIKGFNHDEQCHSMSGEFDISPRQTQRYRAIAVKRIKKETGRNAQVAKEILFSRYEDIYKIAISRDDLTTGIRALSAISDLHDFEKRVSRIDQKIQVVYLDKNDEQLLQKNE